MLQDYELQRRLHAEQLQFGQAPDSMGRSPGTGLSNFRNAIAVMKQLWCAMSLMAGSLLFSVNASADTSSGALLQQMNLASQSLNYELSFVSISKQGVESLRYRHARLNNQPLAQLLQLDGPAPGSGPARHGNQLF